jgi:hypothetical protein
MINNLALKLTITFSSLFIFFILQSCSKAGCEYVEKPFIQFGAFAVDTTGFNLSNSDFPLVFVLEAETLSLSTYNIEYETVASHWFKRYIKALHQTNINIHAIKITGILTEECAWNGDEHRGSKRAAKDYILFNNSGDTLIDSAMSWPSHPYHVISK